MVDPTNMQAEQTQTTETPGTETPTSEEKSERDVLKEVSQQFFCTLFRSGVHLVMTPVSLLPEEPREHLESAGREFTRGLATIAHELAGNFDKIVEEVKTDREKD